MNSKKLFAGVIAMAMTVVALGANTASAATAEELAAQIAALQTQLSSLQGQLGTSSTGTGTTTTGSTTIAACAGITFTRNLTLGSTGTDVKCLQALLNSDAATAVATTGVGSAGNETTSFGGLTKAAVIKFQNKYAAEVLTPVGLTAGTGFVGAQTRIKLNAMLVVAPTNNDTDTDNDTDTTDTDNDADDTTSSGKEGDFSVSLNSSPANNREAKEGESEVAVLGIKIKATGSEIDIERVTLAFTAKPYNYFDKVSLWDGSTKIAESELDADTVSKVDSTDYRVTLSDFDKKFTVAEGATKVMTVKVDVVDNIDTDDLNDAIAVLLPTDSAIRGVDGAGLNQYGGGTTITRDIDLKEASTEGATLTISSNDDNPLDHNVVADSQGEIEDETLLVFDAKAEDDDITITDINNVLITSSVAGKYPDTVYLYDSSNEVVAEGSVDENDSAFAGDDATTVGSVDFEDMEVVVKDGETETFTVKFDYDTEATGSGYVAGMTFKADVAGSRVVAENSKEDALDTTPTGTAEGNLAYIYAGGPAFTISSITTSTNEPETGTSTISAAFKIVVEAINDDVYLPKTGAFAINSYKDDVLNAAADSVSYTKPTNADLVDNASGTDLYKISEGESITFTVNATAGADEDAYYDLRTDGIYWTLDGTENGTVNNTNFNESTYMSGDSSWISDAEYLSAPKSAS